MRMGKKYLPFNQYCIFSIYNKAKRFFKELMPVQSKSVPNFHLTTDYKFSTTLHVHLSDFWSPLSALSNFAHKMHHLCHYTLVCRLA